MVSWKPGQKILALQRFCGLLKVPVGGGHFHAKTSRGVLNREERFLVMWYTELGSPVGPSLALQRCRLDPVCPLRWLQSQKRVCSKESPCQRYNLCVVSVPQTDWFGNNLAEIILIRRQHTVIKRNIN